MELPEKIKVHANSINDSWHKSTDSVIGTARLCADADKKLKAADKSKLFPVLVFSKATFSKLAKIGSNEYLLSKDLRPSLPPSYSILYELAKLSEEHLKLAHADGVLNANMTRNDVERWVAQHREGSEEAEGETFHLFATLRTPVHFDKTREKELEAALDKLMTDFGIAVQRSRNLEDDALARISRKVHDYTRKGARLYIRNLKSARVGDRSHLSPAQRQELWKFSDDELKIDDDATWEQVEDVLELVGAADQFGRLRDEALRLHGVSENAVRTHHNMSEDQAMAQIREIAKGLRRPDERWRKADFSGWH